MTGADRRPWLPILGALSLAVFLVALGALVATAWQSRSEDTDTMTVSDIGFAQDMSVHHDQAIQMSRTIAVAPEVSEEIRRLADRMIVTQTAESATMRGWLDWFGHPWTSTDPMSWMGPTGAHTHGSNADTADHAMPGMASIDELARLGELTGTDAEIWFLQLMLRHHQGGLDMAEAAYNDERSSRQTKQLAITMIGDQGDEIGLMRMLLQDRGAEPIS